LANLPAWLPQPKVHRQRRITSTEQIGYTTATPWAHLRVAIDQQKLFAGFDFSSDDDGDE
jgi:hypothetical protein